MPIQQPQWSDYLSCHICCNLFDEEQYRPISLACGHTLCKACLSKLPQKKCPFDQTAITRPASELPVNFALLQLIGVAVPDQDDELKDDSAKHYYHAKRSIEKLAIFLNPLANGTGAGSTSSPLTRPMQRKLVALVNCQLVEEEGRVRAMRVARSLGERSVTELILLHQNPQQLSTNLWAAVRARGCQFLGPAMQEEVLKLILLALEDGSALSRKVLVLFVVQRLETQYPQASKTAIGHVVQLLYRASCFKVTKREEESSLMQLKEEFRGYEALRREHDAQIVQIASEAGLRISPEQWSSLLYGDTAHKSHMQSIIDKLQTPQSFAQSVNELMIALQRSHDPNDLSSLQQHLETLTNVDPTSDAPLPSWENIEMVLNAVCKVVQGLVEFIQVGGCSGPASATAGLTTRDALDANTLLQHAKFKTSLCRDMTQIGRCPRGNNCTFAHSSEELERYRARSKRFAKLGSVNLKPGVKVMTSSALTPQEQADLAAITQTAQAKLAGRHLGSHDCEAAYRMVDMLGECDEEDICVPVAQPCSLPPNKTSRQPIYMLLSHNTSQQLEPDIVASACKAPSYTPLPSTAILHDPLQGLPISSSANSMYAHIRTVRPMQPDYHVGPSQVKNRGKSPSQKLEELHKRRSELLSQLISPSSQEMSGLAAHNPDQASYPAEAPYKTPDMCGGHSSTPVSIAGVGIHACRMAQSSSPASHCLADDAEYLSVATTSASNNLSTNNLGTNSAHIGTSFGSHSTFLGSSSSHIGSSPAHFGTSPALFGTSPANSGTNSAILSNIEGTSCIYSETSPSHDGQLCPENETLTTRSLLPGCVPSLFPGSDVSHQVSPHTSCYNAVSQENIVEGYQLWPVLTVSKRDDLPGTSFHSGEDVHDLGEASWCNLEHDDDEFIPFEVNVMSKYGPISRGVRARTGNTAPLQVTAAQRMPFNTVQVSSVTSLQRPYPVSGEVPSRFASSHKEVEATNMMLHPLGQTIASSLPTAMMAPNVLAASNFPHNQMSLWAFKDQVMKTGSKAPSGVAEDIGCDLQLRHELARVSHQIQSLEKSENGRLSRELQAIELNIQETERSMHMQKRDEGLATKEQQEATDYKLAQQLALQEVQYQRQASRPTDS